MNDYPCDGCLCEYQCSKVTCDDCCKNDKDKRSG